MREKSYETKKQKKRRENDEKTIFKSNLKSM